MSLSLTQQQVYSVFSVLTGTRVANMSVLVTEYGSTRTGVSRSCATTPPYVREQNDSLHAFYG
jgi:hypothetical protein